MRFLRFVAVREWDFLVGRRDFVVPIGIWKYRRFTVVCLLRNDRHIIVSVKVKNLLVKLFVDLLLFLHVVTPPFSLLSQNPRIL